MGITTFTGLSEAIDRLAEQEKYTEALDLLDISIHALPPGEAEENRFHTAWLFAMLFSCVKKYNECLEVIRGIVNEGYPFPMDFKRFEPLKDMNGYKELYDINEKLLNKARASANIRYEYYINKGAGHDIPSDFDKKLEQAITYLHERQAG